MPNNLPNSGPWWRPLQDALDALIDSEAMPQAESFDRLSDQDRNLLTQYRQLMQSRILQRSQERIRAGALSEIESELFDPRPPARDDHGMFCNHANESPQTCTCPETCYCQNHSCRQRRWLSVFVVRFIRTTLSYGPIRREHMLDLAQRRHDIHPVSLESHLDRLEGEDHIRVSQKQELYQVLCPHYGSAEGASCDGCDHRLALQSNQNAMRLVRDTVRRDPLTFDELYRTLSPRISQGSLLQSVIQLMARGKLITNEGRQFMLAVRRRPLQARPAPRSRFDIINGD